MTTLRFGTAVELDDLVIEELTQDLGIAEPSICICSTSVLSVHQSAAGITAV